MPCLVSKRMVINGRMTTVRQAPTEYPGLRPPIIHRLAKTLVGLCSRRACRKCHPANPILSNLTLLMYSFRDTRFFRKSDEMQCPNFEGKNIYACLLANSHRIELTFNERNEKVRSDGPQQHGFLLRQEQQSIAAASPGVQPQATPFEERRRWKLLSRLCSFCGCRL